MVNVIEVKTRKQRKQFVDFPTALYENCPYYVHPLRMDEINNFNPKKNVSYDDCETACFLAIEDGRDVGRIAAIIQKLYNEKGLSNLIFIDKKIGVDHHPHGPSDIDAAIKFIENK